jgi:hypothetical protein
VSLWLKASNSLVPRDRPIAMEGGAAEATAAVWRADPLLHGKCYAASSGDCSKELSLCQPGQVLAIMRV